MMTKSLLASSIRPTPQVRNLDRLGAPVISLNQVAQSITAPFGFQAAGFFPMQTAAYLSNCAVTGVNAAWNNIGGTATRPNRFVLESSMHEYTFTNSTTAGVDLEIYDLVLKRDIPITNVITVGVNPTSLDYPLAPSPVDYWEQGVQASHGTRIPTLPQYKIVGSTPFDSIFFKDYFKVVKRSMVQLQQGASHRHCINLSPHKLVDNTMYNQGDVSGYRGLTQYVLYVARGLPVAVPDSPTVTTSEVRIDAVQVSRYKVTWVNNNNYASYYADNLTTPISASIVNVGSGQVSAVAQV
jgi:hypothetical protein